MATQGTDVAPGYRNVNQFRSFAVFATYIALLRNWKVGQEIAVFAVFAMFAVFASVLMGIGICRLRNRRKRIIGYRYSKKLKAQAKSLTPHSHQNNYQNCKQSCGLEGTPVLIEQKYHKIIMIGMMLLYLKILIESDQMNGKIYYKNVIEDPPYHAEKM